MRLLDALKIKAKLALVLALSALSLIACMTFAASLLRDKIAAEHEQETKLLVDLARDVAEAWYAKEQSGSLSREQAQAGAVHEIRSLRYGNSEYFFIQRYDGVTVLNTNRPDLEGRYRWFDTDSDGVFLVRQEALAGKNGGGFVYYRFPRAGSKEPVPKVSYVAGFDPWEWSIGTGTYIDDISHDFRSALLYLALVGFGIFGGATLCAYVVNRNISVSLATLKGKMERLAAGELTFDIDEAERGDEIGDMGRAMRVFKDNAVAKRELEIAMNHSGRIDALGRLAGGIAHDLNNALVPVLAMTKTVVSRLPKDNRDRGRLDLVLAGAQRAKDLVQQILAFCRREEVEKREFDLGQVVADGVKMLRASLPSTLKLVSLLHPVPAIYGDPGQFYQVLINLATNAAHAIGVRPGTITIELQPEGGTQLRLSVADDGCGMDEQTKSHIFEAFFTTKEVGKGTGLGLSLVHGIVTSHGGTITVQSAPGKGTQFDILLPTAESRHRAALAEERGRKPRLFPVTSG